MKQSDNVATIGEFIEFLKQFDPNAEIVFHSWNDETVITKITPDKYDYDELNKLLIFYGYM